MAQRKWQLTSKFSYYSTIWMGRGSHITLYPSKWTRVILRERVSVNLFYSQSWGLTKDKQTFRQIEPTPVLLEKKGSLAMKYNTFYLSTLIQWLLRSEEYENHKISLISTSSCQLFVFYLSIHYPEIWIIYVLFALLVSFFIGFFSTVLITLRKLNTLLWLALSISVINLL